MLVAQTLPAVILRVRDADDLHGCGELFRIAGINASAVSAAYYDYTYLPVCLRTQRADGKIKALEWFGVRRGQKRRRYCRSRCRDSDIP